MTPSTLGPPPVLMEEVLFMMLEIICLTKNRPPAEEEPVCFKKPLGFLKDPGPLGSGSSLFERKMRNKL